MASGAHGDVVQFVGGVVNNYVETYNTIYQPATSVDGMEGVQIAAQVGGSVSNSTITNNTLVAPMGAAKGDTMSYVLALFGGTSDPITNTLIANNYIDPTGAWGTFYPLTYTCRRGSPSPMARSAREGIADMGGLSTIIATRTENCSYSC
jgi:hypothetical protein